MFPNPAAVLRMAGAWSNNTTNGAADRCYLSERSMALLAPDPENDGQVAHPRPRHSQQPTHLDHQLPTTGSLPPVAPIAARAGASLGARLPRLATLDVAPGVCSGAGGHRYPARVTRSTCGAAILDLRCDRATNAEGRVTRWRAQSWPYRHTLTPQSLAS